uniref:MalT-like TPR region domain-containing protein n=1 Tax=Chromera velia CCMP2878 TaxID=1169474 RepID=A0A0G4GP27_9ALVE|eukprot:Cvel_4998.t1-p1 / transcript=Cvel_4998.t1 / gene=Cvel_4998 / organism=Chromera_velia_CCMP2878 / gene_product=hypothetical protein / transcript_product=hypothetical protein / location=Cvel_scaffold226:76172-76762(+) / protein_length=197 / sequence_SO=supercontig / SO=protein_coding / is_pseudo=false
MRMMEAQRGEGGMPTSSTSSSSTSLETCLPFAQTSVGIYEETDPHSIDAGKAYETLGTIYITQASETADMVSKNKLENDGCALLWKAHLIRDKTTDRLGAVRLLRQCADVRIASQKLDSAVTHLRRALEIGYESQEPLPNDMAQMERSLAKCLAQLGKRSEAFEHYERAMKMRGLAVGGLDDSFCNNVRKEMDRLGS